VSALLSLVRRDLIATLGQLRHPAAQHIARTAASPAAWHIVAADLDRRTTTQDRHLAAAACRAADALAGHDVEGAARHLARVCGLTVAAWSDAVAAETPAEVSL
jgi:hypothetical protein